MTTDDFARHQHLMIATLENTWRLKTRVRDDMLELVRTYAALSETGYVQLPFMLEKPRGVPSPHFWVSLLDGNEIIALAAFRTMYNGPRHQTCAAFMADGGLYPSQGGRPEAYLLDKGPMLAPQAHFGYLGAGWVHPRWRGHNLAGHLSRIVYAEAAVRAADELALVSAMTFEAMFHSGMNQRASGWHHAHADLVLDGYLAALDKEVRMYFSHNTMPEQAALYRMELEYLEAGAPVPWLREHDKTSVPALLAAAAVKECP
jgi:GNAT superfamily N-acetyltransferase